MKFIKRLINIWKIYKTIYKKIKHSCVIENEDIVFIDFKCWEDRENKDIIEINIKGTTQSRIDKEMKAITNIENFRNSEIW